LEIAISNFAHTLFIWRTPAEVGKEICAHPVGLLLSRHTSVVDDGTGREPSITATEIAPPEVTRSIKVGNQNWKMVREPDISPAIGNVP
jgi:hypothetical protein